MPVGDKAVLHVRLSQADAHYGGSLVDGARVLALFGDAATELLVRHDGDEGLFRAYQEVEFLAPSHAGDFLEVEAELTAVGNTSRTMRFEARRVVAPRADLSPSAADLLERPVVVCRARGTCVVPRPAQRRAPAGPTRPLPVVITAAVVGAEVTRAQNPAVPYTPAEIATAAVAAGRAGAAVVHLHARWPDGRPSQEAAHFREIVDRIRQSGSEVVIQCSTGGAVGMSLEERLGSLVEGAEMGTLNLGTMNFGDAVFWNARPDVVRVAARLRAAGLVPECEVYDAGMLDTLAWLLAEGHLAAPYHVQLVLGVPGGLSASERNLRFLVEGLPGLAHWSAAGVGRHQLPLAELALRMGGHVRVGLEDNLYLARGVLASGSDQLVSLAVERALQCGRMPATPAQARQLLGLPAPRAA